MESDKGTRSPKVGTDSRLTAPLRQRQEGYISTCTIVTHEIYREPIGRRGPGFFRETRRQGRPLGRSGLDGFEAPGSRGRRRKGEASHEHESK